MRAVAEANANIWCSAGVHPDEQVDDHEASLEELLAMADHPKVVAIGETGLDYYPPDRSRSSGSASVFAPISAPRKQSGKPLIIHTRTAAADTLRIMREEGAAEVGGVMHCFTESQAVADAAIEWASTFRFPASSPSRTPRI